MLVEVGMVSVGGVVLVEVGMVSVDGLVLVEVGMISVGGVVLVEGQRDEHSWNRTSTDPSLVLIGSH